MFLAFGAAIALVAFLVVNAAASIAVAVAAPTLTRGLRATAPRPRARVLLALRLLPAMTATAVAAGLVMPAYLVFEPADTGESLTVPLAVLASTALALLATALFRGARAMALTSALVRGWMRDAQPVTLPGSPVPVYKVRDGFPAFSVVGLHRPRMYVSARVLDALTPGEVAAAVAHERAHLSAGDNLKRLLMRSCPDMLAGMRASQAIEREWARSAEEAADEQATAGRSDTALALAASLVKVARIAPRAAVGLPMSALHDGEDVEARVTRLLATGGRENSVVRRRAARAVAAVLAGAALVALGLALSEGLATVHGLIELAARLLG